jgi:integrase/recombinase XerD
MYLGKRPNGIYFVEFFDSEENRKRRISTGKRNKKDANLFLSEFTANQQKNKKVTYISLVNFRDEYVKFVAEAYSKNYLTSIKLSFRQFIKFVDDIPLKKITIPKTQHFLSTVYIKAPKAAELYSRTLKASFNRAVDWGYLSENPFNKIKLPTSKKPYPIFITKSEFKKIIDNTQDREMRDIFYTAFNTGMRLGELVNMKWKSIDFNNQKIYIQNSNSFATKNKRDRVIPLNKIMQTVIANKLKKVSSIVYDDFVFSKIKGIKINEDYVSKAFKKIVRLCGCDERIHFHTLRHSFASNLVQKGASIYIVKELMGHSDVATTQIYAHLNKENLEDVVNLLD